MCKPCGQPGASHTSSLSRQRACYSLPALPVISHSGQRHGEQKGGEVRAGEVRNANRQVRARVTETLTHAHSLSVTAT